MKNTIQYLLLCMLLFLPSLSEACAMCQAGATEEYISAYKMTTAILVLIPLTTVTLLIFWIYKKTKTSY